MSILDKDSAMEDHWSDNPRFKEQQMSTQPEALREALAEQPAQQGPVGSVYRYGKDSSGTPWHGIHWNAAGLDLPDGTLIYTSPPTQRTWVGLTDAHVEMIAAWLETQMIETPTTGPHLANALRYVGAKLKEKNT